MRLHRACRWEQAALLPLVLGGLLMATACSSSPPESTADPKPAADVVTVAGGVAEPMSPTAIDSSSLQVVGQQAGGGNRPPQVDSVSFRPAGFHRGLDIKVTAEGSDPDGEPVDFRYLWIINGVESPWEDQAVLQGDRFSRGDRIALRVIPFDGRDEGSPFLSREIVVPNAPPSFTSLPPQGFEGWLYTYRIEVTDPDDDPLVLALSTGPSGMRLDPATRELRWEIPQGVTGEQKVRLSVEDGHGESASQEYSINLFLKGKEAQ